MCGRFSLMTISKVLSDRFHVEIDEPLTPRYNIAPSQKTPVVLNESPSKITMVRWGLIPHWAKDEKIGYKMINARVETIAQKPSFKHPFQTQRCLVLADGFYEWKETPTGKLPYRVIMKNESPFAFAGIYDKWEHDGITMATFSIITVEPNELMRPLHNRMPAILKPEYEKYWLKKPLISVLKPYPSEEMKTYPLTTLVNNPRNDTKDVLKPKENGLFKYF